MTALQTLLDSARSVQCSSGAMFSGHRTLQNTSRSDVSAVRACRDDDCAALAAAMQRMVIEEDPAPRAAMVQTICVRNNEAMQEESLQIALGQPQHIGAGDEAATMAEQARPQQDAGAARSFRWPCITWGCDIVMWRLRSAATHRFSCVPQLPARRYCLGMPLSLNGAERSRCRSGVGTTIAGAGRAYRGSSKCRADGSAPEGRAFAAPRECNERAGRHPEDARRDEEGGAGTVPAADPAIC